ncbi:hypothetical protein [Ramlibacter albus]|uniref:Uncharacterized protein n=1 Tax=Ramlibacter albus TaxID=2079448 RepID=A0A923S120_9BURK|nr:hypothetical protein [Ramlibacter albus]MBC5763835.1 hypothetical protein [Ramlibacter albus]
MKHQHPLWTPTLAWMAAVAAAVLLALFGPELSGLHNFLSHDAILFNSH